MNPPLASINRVLLVEDQAIIAMDVEYMLTDCGVASVDTAASVDEALVLMEAARPDAAVLDLNLGGHTSLPVAERLKMAGIPFVFATGYGDNSMVPAEFASIPVLSKPYDAEKLARSLRLAMTLLRDQADNR
jgi:CheY-like chemotaxis protein